MIKYKSITNSMRHVCLINKSILRKKKSVTKLFFKESFKNNAGRNNNGKITVFTKGTRTKRLYRLIDTKRNIYDISAKIYSIEYDPNRSSFISLVVYSNNIYCYILSTQNVLVGEIVHNYNEDIDIRIKKGDKNSLMFFYPGSIVHNVEIYPNKGSSYIRSAGTYGKVIKKYLRLNKVSIQLPSGNSFFTSIFSSAVLGAVSNPLHNKIVIGKAGRNRWLGLKSNVRGVAMNPVDHPHGGGEGKKSASSLKKSPWGKISKWTNRNRFCSLYQLKTKKNPSLKKKTKIKNVFYKKKAS